jgi:hypothetical protein
MKKEQEILNLSYQESLRQKNERMAVWDPKDKTAENSQIKKPIKHPLAGLKRWSGIIGPGILTVFYFFLFFLVLSGCAYFKGKGRVGYNLKIIEGREGNGDITVSDLQPVEITDDPVVERLPNEIIACIKLEPECDFDRES